MEHLSVGRTPGVVRVLDFTPWGGAYNRIRPDATAFVHRAERFLLKHDVVVAADVASEEREAARYWLARSWGACAPVGIRRRLSQLPRPGPRGLGQRLPRDQLRPSAAR